MKLPNFRWNYWIFGHKLTVAEFLFTAEYSVISRCWRFVFVRNSKILHRWLTATYTQCRDPHMTQLDSCTTRKNPNSGDELFYWYIVATVCVLTKLRVRTGGAKGNKLHLCNVWCPNILTMYKGTLGYNIQISPWKRPIFTLCTDCGHRMAHRKWKETKQLPSMLPGPAVPGCCLVSFYFL